MKQESMYLSWHPVNQTAISCWPLAISSTASNHQDLLLASSLWLLAEQPVWDQTVTCYFFPAVFLHLEARGSQLEATALAVQPATSNKIGCFLAARGSKLESAVHLIIHNSSFITKNP